MMLLSAREVFPKIKIVLAQREPPLGYDAKMRLRSAAKRCEEYRIPIEISPRVFGHTDSGERIQIDTLGRWLFGVPGYRGHITVIPYSNRVEVFLYTNLRAAVDMIIKAARKLGLDLAWIGSPREGEIYELGGKTMKEFEAIWEDIRSLLAHCGDIGEFNKKDFNIVEKSPYSWTGDRWPLGLDALEEFKERGLKTLGARDLYATMGREAGRRLGITEPLVSAAFGEFIGCIVSGWSERFGNLNALIRRLMRAFYHDGYYRAGYMYGRDKYFIDPEVRDCVKRVFNEALRIQRKFTQAQAQAQDS